jgi:hypothetical protein
MGQTFPVGPDWLCFSPLRTARIAAQWILLHAAQLATPVPTMTRPG